jgi:hypothetical protein
MLMPRWPRVAALMRSTHKARLPSMAFRSFQPEFAKFFKECQGCHCVWQTSLAKSGQCQVHEAAVNALFCREGSNSAASFKSNLPAQPDFFGNSPRRHRPPSDLADGLMRNSSSGQTCSSDKKNRYSRSLGEDFKGRQPVAWQTQFFSRRKSLRLYIARVELEFANRGKLAMSFLAGARVLV